MGVSLLNLGGQLSPHWPSSATGSFKFLFCTLIIACQGCDVTVIFEFSNCCLKFYRTQVSLGSDLWVRFSLNM